MREILFRGKRVDNGKWVYSISILCRNKTGKVFLDVGNIIQDWKEVIPETVGQSTGLTDKNGVKIFEGDITKHHRHETTGTWIYSEHYTCFLMKEFDANESDRFYFKIDCVDLEVIGNIHEAIK